MPAAGQPTISPQPRWTVAGTVGTASSGPTVLKCHNEGVYNVTKHLLQGCEVTLCRHMPCEELIRKLEVQDDVLSQILLKCQGMIRNTTSFHAGPDKYPQPVPSSRGACATAVSRNLHCRPSADL